MRLIEKFAIITGLSVVPIGLYAQASPQGGSSGSTGTATQGGNTSQGVPPSDDAGSTKKKKKKTKAKKSSDTATGSASTPNQ